MSAETTEHDLKARAKKLAGEAFVEYFPIYVEMVSADGKAADYQKMLELAGKVSGLTNTEKADQYANLPIIHITFDGGINADPRGTPAKALKAVDVVDVSPTGDSQLLELAEPDEGPTPPAETPPGEVNLEDLLDFADLEPEKT